MFLKSKIVKYFHFYSKLPILTQRSFVTYLWYDKAVKYKQIKGYK